MVREQNNVSFKRRKNNTLQEGAEPDDPVDNGEDKDGLFTDNQADVKIDM